MAQQCEGPMGRPEPRTERVSRARADPASRTVPPHAAQNRHNRCMFLTAPTLLTWARIASIPLIAGVFHLPFDEPTRNLLATALFVAFALTDWLDGWLARKLNQVSSFGAFLDPVADKFLVCAALLILVWLHRVDTLIALVIIGREIAISALREWMAQIGASRSVAVHMLGKVKTVTQMVAIPFLLYDGRLLRFIDTRFWGTLLIYIAAVLTIWSMVYYLRKALPEIRAKAR
jgi:cardiolipin synthase (CMP-forming)